MRLLSFLFALCEVIAAPARSAETSSAARNELAMSWLTSRKCRGFTQTASKPAAASWSMRAGGCRSSTAASEVLASVLAAPDPAGQLGDVERAALRVSSTRQGRSRWMAASGSGSRRQVAHLDRIGPPAQQALQGLLHALAVGVEHGQGAGGDARSRGAGCGGRCNELDAGQAAQDASHLPRRQARSARPAAAAGCGRRPPSARAARWPTAASWRSLRAEAGRALVDQVRLHRRASRRVPGAGPAQLLQLALQRRSAPRRRAAPAGPARRRDQAERGQIGQQALDHLGREQLAGEDRGRAGCRRARPPTRAGAPAAGAGGRRCSLAAASFCLKAGSGARGAGAGAWPVFSPGLS